MTVNLFAHQRKAVDIAKERERFAYFWDCGTGKTIAMLAACSELGGRTLVVCPKSIMRSAWLRDAANFPGLWVEVIYDANRAKRAEAIRGAWDVAVTNYETFKKHAADFLAAGVDRLIVDESSKIKSPTSQITRAVHVFADKVRSVYLLSGTPAPNNGTEYWGQLRALSREAGGSGFYGFAARYFFPIKKQVRARGQVQEVTVGYRQSERQAAELEELLRRWSWCLRKQDCLDLPEQTDQVVEVEMDAAQARLYSSIRDELRIEAGAGEVSRVRGEAALIKLRQVTGGTLKTDGGRKLRVGGAKLEALGDLMDSIGPESVVIWAEFTEEIRQIAEFVRERGESVEVLDGSTSHDAANIAARFQAGEVSRLVCHPAAAGHGITLTRACYAIYYSLSFSYEQYQQSRDRIHRAGQGRPCTYYHLVCPGTVDETCLRVLRRKASAADAVREVLGMSEEGVAVQRG